VASSKKLIINNLTIVWQGQSWSVITPDGNVKARFPDKNDAINYAEQTLDFKERKISLDELMPVVMNGEEFAFDLPLTEPKTKLKNDELVKQKRTPAEWARYVAPRMLGVVVIAGLVIVVGINTAPQLQGVFQSVLSVVDATVNNILFKIGFLGALVVGIAFALDRNSSRDDMAGCFNIFFLMMAIAICNALGIFTAIWDWVF
jgi:hypothetical protein